MGNTYEVDLWGATGDGENETREDWVPIYRGESFLDAIAASIDKRRETGAPVRLVRV